MNFFCMLYSYFLDKIYCTILFEFECTIYTQKWPVSTQTWENACTINNEYFHSSVLFVQYFLNLNVQCTHINGQCLHRHG